MMSRGFATVLFVVCLILSLLVNMPVAQLLPWLPPQSAVKLADVEGTLFTGRIGRLAVNGIELPSVGYWQQVSCLFTLKVCYKLAAEDSHATISHHLLSGESRLTESRVQLSAIDYPALFQNMLVKPVGEFDIHLDQLTIRGQQVVDVTGFADWNEAGIEGESVNFGDFRAKVSRQENRYSLELQEKKSALKISGGGFLTNNGRYQLDIDIQAGPKAPRQIQDVLQLAARNTSANRYSIKRNGQLPSNVHRWFAF